MYECSFLPLKSRIYAQFDYPRPPTTPLSRPLQRSCWTRGNDFVLASKVKLMRFHTNVWDQIWPQMAPLGPLDPGKFPSSVQAWLWVSTVTSEFR